MTTDEMIERLRDTGCDREPFTAAHAECQCRFASAVAKKLEQQQKAMARAVEIIERNLYHQREKVDDAKSILRQALND